MTVLWIVITLLLIASVGLLFVPWSDKRNISRDSLNQLIYRQRLNELESSGDSVDVQQREALVADLQKNLLDDIPDSVRPGGRRTRQWAYLPGAVALVALTLGMFFSTSSLMQVSEWQQITQQTPALLQRAMNPGQDPLTVNDLSHLALGLRTRLQDNPDNLDSWVVLGRMGVVLDNYPLASQAFERAWRMAPNRRDVKTGYAEILLRSPDESDRRVADVLLQELIQQEPGDPQVLGLIAFSAYGREQYPQAISAWQKMLQLLPPGDSRRSVIERSIASAEQKQRMDVK